MQESWEVDEPNEVRQYSSFLSTSPRKKVSQQYQDSIMEQAQNQKVRVEADELCNHALDMKAECKEKLQHQESLHLEAVCNERLHNSRTSKHQKEKHANDLKKIRADHEVAVENIYSEWNREKGNLGRRLQLAHGEILKERCMWEDVREHLLNSVNNVNDRLYQHMSISRELMQEQLDLAIERASKLLADIAELADNNILLEKENKKLKRELQNIKKVTVTWQKKADKAVARAEQIKELNAEHRETLREVDCLRKALAAKGNLIHKYTAVSLVHFIPNIYLK